MEQAMGSVTLQGIRVVVFDLDDTLYAEREYVFGGYAAAAQWLSARTGKAPDDLVKRLRELFDSPSRPRVFNALLDELGLGARESEWVPAMIAAYRAHEPSIRLLPDAERALSRWGERFRRALISDGDASVQQAKVAALGLQAWIEAVVLTGRWGRAFWKPHARAFAHVEEVFSASGKELVYMADNPVKDFISPRQRGWQSVRIRRSGGVYSMMEPMPGGEPDAEVESLDEITLNS